VFESRKSALSCSMEFGESFTIFGLGRCSGDVDVKRGSRSNRKPLYIYGVAQSGQNLLALIADFPVDSLGVWCSWMYHQYKPSFFDHSKTKKLSTFLLPPEI